MSSSNLLAILLLAVPAAAQAPAQPSARFFWGDLDGDGLRDAFVARPEGGSRLLRNRGDGGFDDVTEALGLAGGGAVREAHWCDFDVDGRADLLLIAPDGSARLLRRGEEGLFAEVGAAWGLELGAGVRSAHWIDFDADGLEDLHVAGSQLDRLWHNLGASFVEVPLELGPGAHAFSTASTSAATVAAAAPAGAGVPAAVPAGSSLSNAFCPLALRDSNLPSCINASVIPTLGQLFPLTTDLNVTSAGNVGIGTTAPISKLDVWGDVRATGKLVSTEKFTVPVEVTSTALCPNLNADLLDGLDASAFSQLGLAIETGEIASGAVTSAKIAAAAVNGLSIAPDSIGDVHVRASTPIQGTKIVSDFGAQDVVTTGDVGAGTATPLADLHVMGSATLGAVLVTPNESISGDHAEVYLAEDDDATFGMKLRYDGAVNQLQVRSATNGIETVRVAIARDSGDTTIGPAVASARLAVDGTDDETQPVVHLRGGDQYGLRASTVSAVYASISGSNGDAVSGTAVKGYGGKYGVHGTLPKDSVSSTSTAVYGHNSRTSGPQYGVRGFANSSFGFAVYADGSLGASGTKSFVQPHPSDPSKSIRFVCLEGNESGTYFRGTADLIGGVATIVVPEEFGLVSEDEGLTVQVTAVGAAAALWIASQDLDRIEVRGNVDVTFHYLVNGVRRGFSELELVRANHEFVPEVRGEPYGTQFPAGLREILVENGTLNPDYTPNEATAAARGWVLRDPEPVPGARQAPEPLPAPPVDR